VVRDFGQGRVAAFMVTGGKEWHRWADGWAAPVYPGLIYELQNYLTSTAGDSGKVIGEPLVLTVDGNRFPREMHQAMCALLPTQADNRPQADLKAMAIDLKVAQKKKSQAAKKGEPFILEYTSTKTLEPGYYQIQLKPYKAPGGADPPTAQWEQVFNVDALKEGNLERASNDDIKDAFIKDTMPKDGGPGKIIWWRAETPTTVLINKSWDLSEWPYLFLIFLGVLVAEQALAVHLSFHLRTSEAELPGQVTQPQARAA
jgi:hypothetical protein